LSGSEFQEYRPLRTDEKKKPKSQADNGSSGDGKKKAKRKAKRL